MIKYIIRFFCKHECDVCETAYKQGRADAERDFQNSDYWNDYLLEIKKQIRADAIDECIEKIVNTPTKIGTHLKEPQKVDSCLSMLADRQFEILDILEQLKENKNE